MIGVNDEKLIDIDEPSQDDVILAVQRKDWKALRYLSLRAGGFGSDRTVAWQFLLHAQEDEGQGPDLIVDQGYSNMALRHRKRASLPRAEDEKSLRTDEVASSLLPGEKEHPDEYQIKLDTDRSFVLYPADDIVYRTGLKTMLNGLITSVLRKRPKLSYFQGYHDIITVLLLTLPEDQRHACAVKLSLHRLRDAMGKGLEPLLGLLNVLKYLMRLADPELAALIERNTPLPYFALSNMLTLFAHEVPTLPLIQHIFDYLLARPPIAIVYLAAVFSITRKHEAQRLDSEGEDGWLHAVLSSLPELRDGDQDDDDTISGDRYQNSRDKLKTVDSRTNICPTLTDALGDDFSLVSLEDKDSDSEAHQAQPQEASVSDTVVTSRETDENVVTLREPSEQKETDSVETKCDVPLLALSTPLPPSPPPHSVTDLPIPSIDISASTQDEEQDSLALNPTPMNPSNFLPSSIPPAPPSPDSVEQQSSYLRPLSPSSSCSSSSSYHHVRRPKVSLPELLERADALMTIYPPLMTPELHVHDILGPQSVVFTWCEDPKQMMSDTEAEDIVTRPTEWVVKPYVDPEEESEEEEGKEGAEADEGEKVGRGKRRGRWRRKYKMGRKFEHPLPFGMTLDKKTVLTGAVVALGVAATMYSVGRGARGGGVGGSHGGLMDIVRSERTWRKAGRWAGGFLAGGGELLLDSLG